MITVTNIQDYKVRQGDRVGATLHVDKHSGFEPYRATGYTHVDLLKFEVSAADLTAAVDSLHADLVARGATYTV